MSDIFLGSIKMMGCYFILRDFAACNGAILTSSSHQSLFTLLGATYGGAGFGTGTFALPDLRGRVPIHPTSTDTSRGHYTQGQSGGYETITLTEEQIPPHNHLLKTTHSSPASKLPFDRVLAKETLYLPSIDEEEGLKNLNALTVGYTGSSEAHSNLMPYTTVSFQIAMKGLYPTRPEVEEGEQNG